jgi:acylphosphatase
MTKIRRRVLISGVVQGVSFRYYTRNAARNHDVYGWVRNLPDGKVEAVFEGEKENVEAMVVWCHTGPPHGRVDAVKVLDEPHKGEFTDFDVRHFGGSRWS